MKRPSLHFGLLLAALLGSAGAHAQTVLFAGGKSFRTHESPCIAMSADEGKTWNLVFEGARKNMDNPSWVTGLAYGGGKLVAVTNYGVVLTSADKGKTWTAQDVKTPLRLNNGFNGVAYGGGMFLAAGSEDALAYSLDGVTWDRLGSNWQSGQAGAASQATNQAKDAARAKIGALAGGKLGGLGAGLAKAKAATQAAGAAAPGAPQYQTNVDPGEKTMYTHTYGVDFIDGKFYLTGNFGRVAVFVPENGKPKRVSVAHVKEQLTSALRDAASNGKGTIVAFADGMMKSATSTDGGQTWEENFDAPQLVGGGYGNGRFVGVSRFGDVATSTDGKTWKSTNIGGIRDGGSLEDAVYTGKTWVLCGDDNCTWYSPDGQKWTRTNSDKLYLKRIIAVK
ncbi:beta propeller repeat protein [Hymenobacter weizhouensis]|uniref:hypothetical protein n=1 Tax=Hymenobacter sp. YIM 151500-1 TaxID=2987689 RepID=UPI0022262679|nr:hypothetical protein [Hymenobacter sp. YIM 151500-1]UYZ62270.1 hypothetical protein OIS53_14860 [Hymenobacter sp. YIM 151500-1]